jgi:hypothetical protein
MTARPRIRADCAQAPRPCPWVNCRYHLAVEAKDPAHMEETCVLDLAERDGMAQEEIAQLLTVTHQRITQIEAKALQRLAKRMGDCR